MDSRVSNTSSMLRDKRLQVCIGVIVGIFLLKLFLARILFFVLVLAVFLAGTVPDDNSFAHWIDAQDLSPSLSSSTLWSFLSSSLSQNSTEESRACTQWIRLHCGICAVVFIPDIERSVIGVVGKWIWTDSNATLDRWIRAHVLATVYTNGTPSSMNEYLEGKPSHFDEMESAEKFRIEAVRYKMDKEFHAAADAFENAEHAVSNVLQKAKYRVEAGRCWILATKNAAAKNCAAVPCIAISAFEKSAEEVSSAGHFDLGARFVAEIASECSKSPDQNQRIRAISLFKQSADLFEACEGNHSSSIISNLERAAILSAESLRDWVQAKQIFQQMVEILVDQDTRSQMGLSRVFFGAILCTIAVGDIVAALRLMTQCQEDHPAFIHSAYQTFLNEVFTAHERWDSSHLSNACYEFDRTHHLEPWQVDALNELKSTLESENLQ